MTPSQNRRMLHSRLAGLTTLLLVACSAATAQAPADKPLNFDDLARPGLNPSSSFRAQGVAHQVNELVDGLGRAHNVEREASRGSSSSSGTSSSSTSSSSSTGSGKSGAQKTFVCTIYCNSSSGPRIEREFTGPDREAVARMIDENSHSICRGSGFAKSSSSKFNPSQCRAK